MMRFFNLNLVILFLLVVSFSYNIFASETDMLIEEGENLVDTILGDNSYRDTFESDEPAEAQKVDFYSIEQAIKTGVERNLSLKVSKEEVFVSRQKVKDARRTLLPKLRLKWKNSSGTTTGEDFEGQEFTVELQQSLYSSGRLANTYLQALVNLSVSRKNLEKAFNEFLFEIFQAYYNLAFAEEKLKNRDSLVKKAESLLKIAERQYEAEGLTLSEIMDCRSQYEEYKFQFAEIQNDYRLAKLELGQLLSLPLNQEIVAQSFPVPNIIDVNLNQVISIGYKTRKDYQVKKLMVLFQQYGLKLAISKNGWNVDLNASMGQSDKYFISEEIELEDEFFVGLKVSKGLGKHLLEWNGISQDKVPDVGQTTPTEFNSGEFVLKFWENKSTTESMDAKVTFHKAIIALESAKKTLIREIGSSYYSVIEAQEKMNTKKSTLSLAEEELRVTRAKQKANQSTIVAVMRSEGKYWNGKTELVSAQADYYISLARLNKQIGVPNLFDPSLDIQKQQELYKEVYLKYKKKDKSKKWYQFNRKSGAIIDDYSDDVVIDSLVGDEGVKKGWLSRLWRKNSAQDEIWKNYPAFSSQYEFLPKNESNDRKWYQFWKKKPDDFFTPFSDENKGIV